MQIWITKEIESYILKLGYKTKICSQGGDVDTTNIIIPIGKEHFRVSGFVTQGSIELPDNTEIEMVELTDGQDSAGGLNSHNPKMAEAYIRIRQTLVDRGFIVVPTMDAYF